MSAIARGFLLELAAEAVAPIIGGCAGAIVAGPIGAAGGAAVGRVIEKAINYFGPKIVERWLDWFRRQPKNVQIEAVAGLGSVPAEEARQVAKQALDRLAPDASPEDKSLALEYITAIPEVVQQSLVLDLSTGGMTVLPSLSLQSPQSLITLLPTDVPPYAAPTPLPGTPYFLKRVVGVGGFGVVYEAEIASEQYLQRAIKLCLDASMLDMLKRERYNLEQLRVGGEFWPPRLVRLYGSDLDHPTPFLVYEYVRGGTLTSYLAKRREETGGNLSAHEVLGLIRQITEALAFAHAHGLVHRDLKPANVLVDGETLKLADFGIGAIMAKHATDHSQIGRSMVDKLNTDEQVSLLRGSGTPLYMDPDQRRGGDANAKHDLYSLVVVWYQLLVGDVTREKADGWDEELESDFGVPKDHIEVMKNCGGLMKSRPANACELRKLLEALSTPRLDEELEESIIKDGFSGQEVENTSNQKPNLRELKKDSTDKYFSHLHRYLADAGVEGLQLTKSSGDVRKTSQVRDVVLEVTVKATKARLGVAIICLHDISKRKYGLLDKHRKEIEIRFGGQQVEWQRRPNVMRTGIAVYRKYDWRQLDNEDYRSEITEWIFMNLKILLGVRTEYLDNMETKEGE